MPVYATPEQVWLTVEEAARILRMNPYTLYRGINREEVPHVTVGGIYKIPGWFLMIEPKPNQGFWWQEELPLVWGPYKPTKRRWRNRPDLVVDPVRRF